MGRMKLEVSTITMYSLSINEEVSKKSNINEREQAMLESMDKEILFEFLLYGK